MSRNSSVNKTGRLTAPYKVFDLNDSTRGREAHEFRQSLKRSCSKNEAESPIKTVESIRKECKVITEFDRNRNNEQALYKISNRTKNSDAYFSVIEQIGKSLSNYKEERQANKSISITNTKYNDFKNSNIKYQDFQTISKLANNKSNVITKSLQELPLNSEIARNKVVRFPSPKLGNYSNYKTHKMRVSK